jgi:hypothetical protein
VLGSAVTPSIQDTGGGTRATARTLADITAGGDGSDTAWDDAEPLIDEAEDIEVRGLALLRCFSGQAFKLSAVLGQVLQE